MHFQRSVQDRKFRPKKAPSVFTVGAGCLRRADNGADGTHTTGHAEVHAPVDAPSQGLGSIAFADIKFH